MENEKELNYKELQKFDNLSTEYLVANGYFVRGTPANGDKPATQGRFTEKVTTKLVANIKKVLKQSNTLFEEYADEKDNLQLDNCLVDEKTKAVLLHDNGLRKFSPEGEKKLKEKIKELDNKKIKIRPRITEGDFKLTDEEKEVFSGIVIPEIEEEKE